MNWQPPKKIEPQLGNRLNAWARNKIFYCIKDWHVLSESVNKFSLLMEWKQLHFAHSLSLDYFMYVCVCVCILHSFALLSLYYCVFRSATRIVALIGEAIICFLFPISFFSALANVNCINTMTKSCQMAVSNYTENLHSHTQTRRHADTQAVRERAHSMQLPSGVMQHLIIAHTHRCTLKRPLFKWKTTSHSTIVH